MQSTADELLKVLDFLGRELDPSILIGGWATQIRVSGEISVDIDLIIGSPEVRQKLKSTLPDYSETRHHSGGMKARGTLDQVHVDAYIPHESFLGNALRLDVATLSKHVDPQQIRGWRLLTVEAHLLTKFAALIDRPDTEKGEKDAREIWSLLQVAHDHKQAITILLQSARCSEESLVPSLQRLFDLVSTRAKLNKQARKTIANLRRVWVDELLRQLRRSQG